MDKRDHKIDWIRAICSLTVVLAHVGAPNIVNQIRCFDVVALVLISGMSMKPVPFNQYGSYLKKRVKRLLIPTYIMMTSIFLISYLLCLIMKRPQLYSAERMIRSFFLLYKGSMGYVWIIRVYLSIALLTPILYWINQQIKKPSSYGLYLVCAVSVLYLLKLIGDIIPSELASTVFFDYLYSSLVYAMIAQIGIWVKQNNVKNSIGIVITGVGMALFGFVQFVKNGLIMEGPNDYKFPPEFLYCCYGLFVAFIMYAALPQKENVFIKWVSSHSLEIYLWHIVFLRIVGILAQIPVIKVIEKQWCIEYIVVLTGSIEVVYLIDKLRNTHLRAERRR